MRRQMYVHTAHMVRATVNSHTPNEADVRAASFTFFPKMLTANVGTVWPQEKKIKNKNKSQTIKHAI